MKKQIVTILTLAACLTSCNNDTESTLVQKEQVPLRVMSSIKTRAVDATWEKNDAIGIYMFSAGTQTVVGPAANRLYTTATGNGAFTATGDNIIYFPVEGSKVDFRAYSPYQKLTNNSYSVNVSNQSSLPAIDLMTAKVQDHSKLTPTVQFDFQHRLTKLELTITAGKGIQTSDLQNLTVCLTNQRTEGSYDPLLDAFSIPMTSGMEIITLNTATDGSSAQAILLPNDVAENTPIAKRQFVFTLKKTGEVFYWTLDDAKSFNRGDKNIYNITINRTSVDVTATIQNWNVGNGTGEPGSAE
ncbi:MAG: fimbrillin family protein [Bacteroidaceae bacterium]